MGLSSPLEQRSYLLRVLRERILMRAWLLTSHFMLYICMCVCAVSYTHLDVYKRQVHTLSNFHKETLIINDVIK